MRDTDWTIFPVVLDYLKVIAKAQGYKVKVWNWKIYVKTPRHLRVTNPNEIMATLRTGEFKHWITRLQKETQDEYNRRTRVLPRRVRD